MEPCPCYVEAESTSLALKYDGSPKLAVPEPHCSGSGSNSGTYGPAEPCAAAVHRRRAVRSAHAAKCRAICLAVSAMMELTELLLVARK